MSEENVPQNPEFNEEITADAIKQMISQQMQAFDQMNSQINTMLDGFDSRISELSNKIEDLKKQKTEKDQEKQ